MGKEECSAVVAVIVEIRATYFCATLRTVARQAPLSMGLSRQEYWGGLPFPPPGDLTDPMIKAMPLASPALAGGFAWEAQIVHGTYLH